MLAGFSQTSNQQGLPQRVVVLGSTGSIGTSALEVIANNETRFKAWALVAGSNVVKLAEQALQFQPEIVICADPTKFQELKNLLSGKFTGEIQCGQAAIDQVVSQPEVDSVLAAIVGVAGLLPVYAALLANKTVALANKESLVSAGELIKELLQAGKGRIVPVDSEHSAIFQALQGEQLSDLKRVILTASGGPFLNRAASEFSTITPAQALKHPNWNMGNKITIDSATMMNKALEVIEAYWLYGENLEQIDVLIHPQSIVHSLVELHDGSQMAQLSVPDMKGAIAYALSYPNGRLKAVMKSLNLAAIKQLDFYEVQADKFPGINLAKQSVLTGGAAAATFNLANELAVEQFLREQIRFDQIFCFVQQALELAPFEPLAINTIAEQLELMKKVLLEKIKFSR